MTGACIPRRAVRDAEWDAFAATCRDAWLWHTTRYLRLVEEETRFGAMTDFSFAVRDGAGDLLALVPLPVTEHDDWRGVRVRETLCTGWSAPMPALRDGMAPAERDALFAVIAAEIDRVAAAAGVQRAALFVAAQQETLAAECRTRHPLLAYGWADVSETEQGIDLTGDLAAIEAGYRRRYARYLRAIRDRVSTAIGGAEAMHAYEHLMLEDSVMRPHRSAANARFIADLLAAGRAFAVQAMLDGEPAGVLVVLHERGHAFDYAVTIADRCRSLRIGHAMKAAAVRHLKAQGARLYDLGIATFGPTAQRVPNPKQVGITEFKAGFANCRLPLVIVEKFYDAAYAAALRGRRAELHAAYAAGAPQ